MDTASFQCDPQLALLLSERYRSPQQAILSLVRDAGDAGAKNLNISMPDASTEQHLVIDDDGPGMTNNELRRQYLVIELAETSVEEERTPDARRLRGKKRIAKLAGFVFAHMMRVESCSSGERSTLEIRKSSLPVRHQDLDTTSVPFAHEPCEPKEHGTTVTLSLFDLTNPPPTIETLREALALEFGRCAGFTVRVNERRVTHSDIQGELITKTGCLPCAGAVSLRFTIVDKSKKPRRAGVVVTVGESILSGPHRFGLDSDAEIPRKLLQRVAGEIVAAALSDLFRAGGNRALERSQAFREVEEWACKEIKLSLSQVLANEFHLAKARQQKRINEQLARLPEHRRPLASRALDNVMRKFFLESEQKIGVIISLVLDAIERDDYWVVCQKIEEAPHSDVAKLAEVLQDFGLLDLICTGQQARNRLVFLDKMDELLRDKRTLESTMHQALEKNLWVFGYEYSLISSNKSLSKMISDCMGDKFDGDGGKTRPDLFLGEDPGGRRLLIEFKRPSHSVGRDDVNQAEKYRDYLTRSFEQIEILVVGGAVSLDLFKYPHSGLRLTTYAALISAARTQLHWLVAQLRSNP
jgi:hypothetical protein